MIAVGIIKSVQKKVGERVESIEDKQADLIAAVARSQRQLQVVVDRQIKQQKALVLAQARQNDKKTPPLTAAQQREQSLLRIAKEQSLASLQQESPAPPGGVVVLDLDVNSNLASVRPPQPAASTASVHL